MRSLIVSSIDEYSGKSGFIAALGRILREKGLEVGYFKPFTTFDDADVEVMKNVLSLEEDDEKLCPIRVESYVEFMLSSDPVKLRKTVIDSFSEVAEGKDIVFVEGSMGYFAGEAIGLSDIDIASMLSSKVLMIAKYSGDFTIDRLLSSSKVMGDMLAVINQVIGFKRTYFGTVASKILEPNGIKLVGMLPKDEMLAGMCVEEIRKALNGIYLVEPKEDILIESFLIGAMSPQTAMSYFRAARNAAVITGGDRADLHAVAIDAGIKCLILTGNLEPPATILGMAEKYRVPVILVKDDTLTTAEKLGRAFGRVRIGGEKKLKRFKEIVEHYVDVPAILKNLGIDV